MFLFIYLDNKMKTGKESVLSLSLTQCVHLPPLIFLRKPRVVQLISKALHLSFRPYKTSILTLESPATRGMPLFNKNQLISSFNRTSLELQFLSKIEVSQLLSLQIGSSMFILLHSRSSFISSLAYSFGLKRLTQILSFQLSFFLDKDSFFFNSVRTISSPHFVSLLDSAISSID